MWELVQVILLIIVLIVVLEIRGAVMWSEHQGPGHGSAGQNGLIREKFYTSGASLRQKSEADQATMQNIDEDDFAKKSLAYYTARPF